MARQRFIHPSLWDDPDLGKLPTEAMLLYIACFSNADDDGRLVGDPAHLRALAFKYRRVSERRTRELREMIAERCGSFCVYTVGETDYIAFRNWSEFQHPKYPKPSALPEPPSPTLPPRLGEE